MSREIPLTKGKVAIVDDEDYEFLSQWRWQYHEGYAVAGVYIGKVEDRNYYYNKRIWMHRLIMECPDEMVVDHIDGVGLNNTRKNLRICTPDQNRYNQRPQTGRLSPYKGVTIRGDRYIARIRKEGVLYNIGSFTNEIACANAYNYYAKKYFGEFARINEVDWMSLEEWSKYKSEVSRTSNYVGVSLDRRTGKYESYLSVKNKKYFLGYHKTEKDAVIARNNKIIELDLDLGKLQEVVL